MAAVHVATNLTDVRPLFPEHYSINLGNPLELEQRAQAAFEKPAGGRRGRQRNRALFRAWTKPTRKSSGALKLGGPT